MHDSLKFALASYSQIFISGQRQLDPEKLSKVMFFCGMAQGFANALLAPPQQQNTDASLLNQLNSIDRVME